MPNQITAQLFDSLSIDEQEIFINRGGTIISPFSSPTIPGNGELKQTGISNELSSSHNETKESIISVDSPSVSPFSDGFDIKDPVELLFMLDDDISSGKDKLHPWQVLFMRDFANEVWNANKPFQAAVRAANGSGKDKYCIAACAVWISMRYPETICPITSASGFQLDKQTCYHIKRLAEQANSKWCNGREDVWKLNYRSYECKPTRSFIFCYATDESGKAEGFHPASSGKKMAIFMSEDKTIPDEINIAINKCNGYTHRIHASSPGNAFGHFYDICQTAIMRNSLDTIESIDAGEYVQYHIPASKCPHLAQFYFKQMERDLPGGKEGAAYKSQVEAEFAVNFDDLIVLPFTYINIARKLDDSKWVREPHNKAGLDLSDGGAETVLVVRNGNKILGFDPFKFDNTEDTIDYLCKRFEYWNLQHEQSYIFGDCVGMGKPVLNRLKAIGWRNIRFIDSRHRPYNPTVYKNYGTELWFNFASFCKRREILLPDDALLCKQLATRYYKLIEGKIHQLLSKPEQRSKGYPSPDRADATVYAFADYKSSFKEQEYDEKLVTGDEKKPQNIFVRNPEHTFDARVWAKSDEKESRYGIGKKQDFSYLEQEIRRYNQTIKQKDKVI